MSQHAASTRRIWILVTVWTLLVVGAVGYGITTAEAELSERADDALAAAGVAGAGVEIRGRDAVVTGATDDRSLIQEALGSVEGIRTVRFASSAAAPAPTTEAPVPSTQAPPTTIPPASTAAPTTTPPTAGMAFLHAELRGGAVVIEGAIPDAEAAARLGALAELIYAPFLDNRLEVDESLAAEPWVPTAATIIARLPIVGTSAIRVSGSEATLSGLAPTAERRAQLEGAMQQALGADVALTSDVTVTGFAPPFVQAEAPGDGTVTLSGTMPSQEVVRLIAGTAIEVFGADAVDNQLVVGENIDTTFSLFRLPLTFVAFKPVPIWQVTIDDDLITGALRGGATFPFGSSELTPEIEALMPVAAGILARNPTLGMVIEGHTDDSGSEGFNMRLSVARAEAARQWLIEAGIEPERVLAVGYGEERPIADNETEEGQAENRRVEFVLGPAAQLGEQP
jgi:outer membrane protein OmpA-like peptidoglycan-associated protein